MAAPILVQTISQIGALTELSQAVQDDWLAFDPQACKGAAGPNYRSTVEPAPGADGAFVFDDLDDAWLLTLVGDLMVTSNGLSTEGDYFGAVRILMGTIKSALDTLKTSTGNLVHSGGTETCKAIGALDDTWTSFWTCRVTFQLAVNPVT